MGTEGNGGAVGPLSGRPPYTIALTLTRVQDGFEVEKTISRAAMDSPELTGMAALLRRESGKLLAALDGPLPDRSVDPFTVSVSLFRNETGFTREISVTPGPQTVDAETLCGMATLLNVQALSIESTLSMIEAARAQQSGLLVPSRRG